LALVPRKKKSELLEKVSIKIKKLRQEKGLSQRDLQNDTGLNIGRIESTPQDLPLSTLEALSKYFGITLSEFFKGI